MAYFFKKLTDRLGHIADSINGNVTLPDTPEKDDKTAEKEIYIYVSIAVLKKKEC